MLIFFTILIIAPLFLVGVVTYNMSARSLSSHVQTSYQEIVKQVCGVINVSMEEIARKLKAGSADTRLRGALLIDQSATPEETYDNLGYIQSYLQSLYIPESGFESAGIITRSKSYGNAFSKNLTGTVDFFNSPFYKKIKAADGAVVWEGTHQDSFSNGVKVISAARLEKDIFSGDELGVSLVNLKPEFFRSILNEVSIAKKDETALFIIDTNMNVVTSIHGPTFEGKIYSDTSVLNEIKKESTKNSSPKGFFYLKNNIIFFDTIKLTGWTIVAIVPDKIIRGPSSKIGNIVIWVALISILISLFLAVIMAGNVAEPIKSIVNVMKEAENGNYTAKCEVLGRDEMAFLGNSLNTMLGEIKRSKNELENFNKTLENRVEERTKQLKVANDELLELNNRLNIYSKKQEEQNSELSRTLETLKLAQNQLIQSEKMAALGSLVAGMAHEINTPIGVSVTAVTYLLEQTNDMVNLFNSNRMKKSAFEKYLNIAQDSTLVTFTNLKKASDLVASFKRVSIDMSNEDKRIFNVQEYLNNILLALSPEFKGKNYNVTINCNEKLEILSYPGALSQIFTNLIMNSIIHGFNREPYGNILIDVRNNDQWVVFEYGDDGKGIPESIRDRVFEPFFTTKRNDGGTGLGLNIVYNLVTQTLEGKISIKVNPDEGTMFIIEIPQTGNPTR